MNTYNFTDAWQVIFKNDGRPLIGKLEFCDPVTTELKTIYDVDDNELENPIYTNALPSHQIMLDGDYTVRYYEYIGPGQMEGDMAEEHWRLYKTELIKQNIIAGENDTTGIYATVTTIEQLKEMDTPTDGSVVGVVGYYTAEDCPIRYYVWHDTGNYVDDGGIVIKSNNSSQGAWVMKIPGGYIDVRWYGDIPSNMVAGTGSNLGQRTKAATAANKYRKDLYFPSYGKGNSIGYYLFDGSNTVSVDKDIIIDNGVRFTVKHGTTGTQVTCHELKGCDTWLFISELNQTIGGYNITADVVYTDWYYTDKASATGAREKYVVNSAHAPLHFSNSYVEIPNEIAQTLYFDNCHIDAFKKLSGTISMSNMVVKTDWFVDNYDWTKLSLYNCQIELENCKDADTYVTLKTKQNDNNYGDLGEQTIHNKTLLSGCIAENATFTNVTLQGSAELHNITGDITLSNGNNQNWIDCWLTINGNPTITSLQARRGEIKGSGTMRLTSFSSIDDINLLMPINAMGAITTIQNSDIKSAVTCNAMSLTNNAIAATIDQSDFNGVIQVACVGNMFYSGAQHYIHANTANSVVKGIWAKNGSAYDDKHWIKIDRTNLKYQDNDHQYTYTDNSEPYLMKFYGRNRPMHFNIYAGSFKEGRGVFSTTTMPFVFFNKLTKRVYVVPRYIKWKAFSVGRGFLARSFTVRSDYDHAISEADYSDHTNGAVTIVYTWGAEAAKLSHILNNDYFGFSNCVSRDGDGVANYDVSFESEDADHTSIVRSYGVQLGVLTRDPYDGWGWYSVYPASPQSAINLFVYPDNDFKAGVTSPQS
jgi:hypothetical protein